MNPDSLRSPQTPSSRRTFATLIVCVLFIASSIVVSAQSASSQRWTEAKAQDWYAHQPWLVGSNYIPTDAINQLEMWQPETFNPQQIDRELGWAQSIGMNTMRVFLHDLLWQQDAAGFQKRIDIFLTIASKHGIRPIFVIFDSCWEPVPKLGPQHPPIPGVHNSGWVQSPGQPVLRDASQYPRLETYVRGVVGAFANDKRILAWDLWNEPDNGGDAGHVEVTNEPEKSRLVANLLPQVFAWARSANPTQPLTSAVWYGEWNDLTKQKAVPKIQLSESDVITFHNYGWPEDFRARVEQLKTYHRPIICTEYMARGAGSTFDTILPIALELHVAAINWGFVNGKTQTDMPWDSWHRPYVDMKPTLWFHDIFYPGGKPYRQHEVDLIKELTTKANGTH
jgi:hypothetical protein